MVYWEVWEKLILNKPVTLQGKCKQEKNGVNNTKTVSAHAGSTPVWYLLKVSNIQNRIHKEEKQKKSHRLSRLITGAKKCNGLQSFST